MAVTTSFARREPGRAQRLRIEVHLDLALFAAEREGDGGARDGGQLGAQQGVAQVVDLRFRQSIALDKANCKMGTLDALYESTKGGVVPGGEYDSCTWDTAVIYGRQDKYCSTSCWKKYLPTAVQLTYCVSVCSTSFTVVCAMRSENSTMRFAISSGSSPL